MNFKQKVRWQQLYVIFLMLGLNVSNLDAQSINRVLNDVAMPSANATAFGKYGDIPVGHFTGVPNISVPITTIQEGTLSLPISLSYHASGIKVAELASWVGLGWNLNFGGQISRTILGFADESEELNATTPKGYLHGGSVLAQSMASGIAPTVEQLGSNDLEPDIFSFTAGGYSGKFYINANKEAVLIPKQNIVVEFNRNTVDLNSFTLITPDGVRYIYGMDVIDNNRTVYEHVVHKKNIAFEVKSISIWHLVRIEDYTRNFWIKFDYVPESYQYPSLGSELINIQKTTHVRPMPDGNAGIHSEQTNFESALKVRVDKNQLLGIPLHEIRVEQGQRLSHITTGSGFTTINFNATTIREDLVYGPDLTTAKRLHSIDIQTSAGMDYLKTFQFNYDYLIDGTVNPTQNAGGYNKRLRLLSVTESAPNSGINLPPYLFEYNGTNQFPNRLSQEFDDWGFYNGRSPYNAPNTTPWLTISGVTRSSDENYMKKGVLNKIIYPTGGYTAFEFEGNSVRDIFNGGNKVVGGLRVRTITSSDGVDPTKNIITRYDYSHENNDLSTGVLSVTPQYFQTFAPAPFNALDPTRLSGYNNINFSFYLHVFSNVPVVPLGDFSGSHIGYNRVSETKTGNGKTVYQFYQENPSGFDDIVYTYYPALPIPPSVKTGSLHHSTSFDQTGLLVDKSSNESSVNYTTIGYAYRPKIITTRAQALVILVSRYPLVKPNFVRTTRQTIIKDGVTTVTDNGYGLNEISLPTTTTTTNSDNKVQQLQYKYPHEFQGQPEYDAMISHNLITPIEIYRKVNGTITEGSKIAFSTTIAPTIQKPMPWKSFFWNREATPNWQETGEIKEYWQNGALKRFKATGSTVEMEYTWNKGVLTQKKFGTLISNFQYINNNSRLLESIIDENGLKTKFYYDGLQRLIKTENRMKDDGTDVQATTEYAYQYKDANNPYNFLRTTNTFKGVSTPQVTEAYLDGLGRSIGGMKQNYTPDGLHLLQTTTYDVMTFWAGPIRLICRFRVLMRVIRCLFRM